MPNEHEPIKIDLRRQETEAGWIAVQDRLGLKATPVWFNWIGWIIALGALHYFHDKSQSIAIAIIIGISYVLLWFYFIGFFFRFEIKGIPFLAKPRIARLISFIISGSFAFAAWQVATTVAREIARFQQSGSP